MQLSPFQRRILSQLESLPTGVSELVKASLIERSQIQLGEAMTGLLRSLRPKQPMIWDPWILKTGNLYRLYYLRGLEGQTPWWTVSNLCGAVSEDLENWHDLGTLLKPNPNHSWESGRICAGCTYQEDGVLYLFYSAGGKEMPDLRNEAIALATSTDGLHWQRQLDHFPLIPTEQDPWYGRCNLTQHVHWRDPYVFKDPQDDRYYLFICASAKTPGNFQGCVGLAVSDTIAGPYQLLPPVSAPTLETADHWPFYHMERPQVLFKNGRYHLFFSCFRVYLNPSWLSQVNSRYITNSTLYWYVSDAVTGPYLPMFENESIVPGSDRVGMYGMNFLPVTERLDDFIAYGWYHRLHTLGVSSALRATWKERDRIQLFFDAANPIAIPFEL
ncbi:beta-fructosidase [Phormidesmis sp. 146-35]